jgi:Tol biopolymer transport system component
MAVAFVFAHRVDADSRHELRDPTWSPDGTVLAYLRDTAGGAQIETVRFDGTHRRLLTPSRIGTYGLSWSPDGRSLAYASAGDIWRVDVGSGSSARLTNAPELGAFQPAWSPDGKTIAFTVFEGCFRCTRIYAIDASGGNLRLLADGGRRPRWSRPTSLLLTSSPVTLHDVTTGENRVVGEGNWASWSQSGDEFTYWGPQGVYVSTPTRVSPQLVLASRRAVEYPTLSPFGSRLAFVLGERVSIYRRFTRERIVLARSDSAHDAPAWSFRGQLAFVADGSCGSGSEIDVVRSDGSRQHALVRACS